MIRKYVCIHGHFYQPPRENPWLEEIEVQDSAHPYRDWNERITAECYSTNSASRIIRPDKRIEGILNNYSRISFNFGPTLLSWMEKHAAETYEAIITADAESVRRFGGHGGAIAQVYNHMIMPLANERDRRTQIIWGIEDFTHRFRRFPEGMWLAETAVDTGTLEQLALSGIRFTILAPHQASSFRLLDETDWTDAAGGSIDTRRAYLCTLPSGRTITLFFYDGTVAREIAFGHLLSNGKDFADRMMQAFSQDPAGPELSHIATDGETYGHHRTYGDMALAYCLTELEKHQTVRTTVYGEFLEIAPPEYEVRIIENTSWSCVHGIERWRADCGCGGGHAGWNQQWRKPLRETYDWLRDSTEAFYADHMREYTSDPWIVRNSYIRVILNRDHKNLESFFEEYGLGNTSEGEPETTARTRYRRQRFIQLLEMQRHLMLMYTSCGWFFEELSGIETVQTLQYAARALQLVRDLGAAGTESEFLTRLESIHGNAAHIKTGRQAYELHVRPAVVDLYRVAAHFGISSLWSGSPEGPRVFIYEVESEDYAGLEAGRYRIAVGRARFRSVITLEEETLAFAFLHLGDHNLNGGVREVRSTEEYTHMKTEITGAFRKLTVSALLGLLDHHFGTHRYSLESLFREESQKVYSRILKPALGSIEFTFRAIYENNYPVMISMLENGIELPEAIRAPVDFVINTDIRRILEAGMPADTVRLRKLKDEALHLSVKPDRTGISYAATCMITSAAETLAERPFDTEILDGISDTVEILLELSIVPNLWKAQNILFSLRKNQYADFHEKNDTNRIEKDTFIMKLVRLEQILNTAIIT